ncbi:HAD family hydrolase [Pseudarthrobacter scleromae]|uniref:HAD family hydrolase n=1 Tax=Pseudarthrobacter scleromae TaxID=158897 RepID=UPI003D026657
MEIRAVLFDLDNTLFDHAASARAGLDAFLQHLGTTSTDDLARAWFQLEGTTYDRFLARELSFHEQRRERLRQFLPLTGLAVPTTDRLLDGLFDVYLQSYQDAWAAFPDAGPALQSLHDGGIRVGVITNGNHRQQALKVSEIGLGPVIGRIFSSESMGHAKPSSEAFMQPCEILGISPAQALYVGDNFRIDVEGARNAGLHAILLNRDAGGPEGTIQSLSELIPLLGAGTGAANDSITLV